ncbi:hypothetical protein [Quisquiliibacterium transsilvanicum]|uniref:KOW domain-containing protein n=2 Tax=Quisquiliibacterium transsilvanicum TaxID=1549638 RepID=A0A7W8HGF3_9BURK|nr:hypothetical protein [Quisquiliibacterium transsilvanicum]
MRRMLDMEDLPIGARVRTPTGRVGTVVKHRGAESKRDHFQRVVVFVGPRPRDTVALQPHLLERVDKCPPEPGGERRIDR